jgi:hypothetical protein
VYFVHFVYVRLPVRPGMVRGVMSNQVERMRERLIAAGCPVDRIDPQIEKRQRDLAIRLLNSHESSIFDLQFGGTGYMLDVAITNLRSRPFTVCELSVELPWDDPQFFWLEDPHESSPESEDYFFSRSLTFPRTMVLNHLVLDYGRIPRYRVLTGLLLGRSFGSIPASYNHGSQVQAVIHVVDYADADHVFNLSIFVDRKASIQSGDHTKRKFGGLLGPCGYGPGNEPPSEAEHHVTMDSKPGAAACDPMWFRSNIRV